MKYPKLKERIEWANPKYRYRYGRGRPYTVTDCPNLTYKGRITGIKANDIPYGYVKVHVSYPRNLGIL